MKRASYAAEEMSATRAITVFARIVQMLRKGDHHRRSTAARAPTQCKRSRVGRLGNAAAPAPQTTTLREAVSARSLYAAVINMGRSGMRCVRKMFGARRKFRSGGVGRSRWCVEFQRGFAASSCPFCTAAVNAAWPPPCIFHQRRRVVKRAVVGRVRRKGQKRIGKCSGAGGTAPYVPVINAQMANERTKRPQSSGMNRCRSARIQRRR